MTVRTQQKEMGLVLRLFSLSTARWLKNSGDAPKAPQAQISARGNNSSCICYQPSRTALADCPTTWTLANQLCLCKA